MLTAAERGLCSSCFSQSGTPASDNTRHVRVLTADAELRNAESSQADADCRLVTEHSGGLA